MDFNNNLFLWVGIIGINTIIFYFCYRCTKKIYNTNVENNSLEYSIVIDDTISNNIIHQDPIPPSYKEVEDDLISIPPSYKE